jgi:hypothetical protein
MKLRHRFLAALAASVAVHLAVLSGPAWLLPALGDWLQPDPAPALEARLVSTRPVGMAPRPPAKAASTPVRRRTMPRAAPEEATPVPAADLPRQPVPEAPEETAAAETLAPETSALPQTREIALPRHVRIRYRVTMGEAGFVVGQAIHDWRHNGFNYWLHSSAETTGLAAVFKPARVVHFSEGDVVEDGLRPRAFSIERNGSAAESARFDWQTGRVFMGDGRGDLELKPDTQDMMSMFGQLALMNFSDRSRFSFSVATGKKVETYEFTVLGIESISTPLGDRPALHLRTGSVGDKEFTEVWLSQQADMAHLPLKIRHVDKRGGVFDQLAETIEVDDGVDGDH